MKVMKVVTVVRAASSGLDRASLAGALLDSRWDSGSEDSK
jgi:hypothetical protein